MFMSTRHQEGLAHLLYGVDQGGGFVALTGEVGTGKTTLCRCLLQQLPKNVDIALVLNPKLNAVELLATICDDLGIKYDKNNQSLKNLVDILNHYLLDAHANNRRTVLLIDEAQNLSQEVLEQIRLLTNLETSKTKLLQIILVGQPELNELLNRRELRQLNQRITARYHLLPLSLAETKIYIQHRLSVCKGDPDLFKDNAIKQIYSYSKGIPRVINIICHCALLGAYATDSHTITPAIIKRAAKETLGARDKPVNRLKPLLGLLAISTVIAGLYFRYSFSLDSPSDKGRTVFLGKLPTTPPLPLAKPATSLAPTATKFSDEINLKSFIDELSNPSNTLSNGIKSALKRWGKENFSEGPIDCNQVQKNGLFCLFDKGNWKDLTVFNRPTVMEFTIPDKTKRYALLVGINNGQPVFHFDKDKTFPLAEVLSLWDGYYLLLWQSPVTGLNLLAPGQSSANVLWLREQLNEIQGTKTMPPNPQIFDNELKRRVIEFQKLNHLTPDGKVGVKTIFYLDSGTGAKNSPHLKD